MFGDPASSHCTAHAGPFPSFSKTGSFVLERSAGVVPEQRFEGYVGAWETEPSE